ncbi:MAG TPA: 2-oxo-4-hydroxy-4-carboxy-5-ureidoimidazoline decarboxylase [Solirubrobacteraceae bacterium]|jgi:OHCU decarboxylase|nr:2-oxo-4-hydroxy-4-carboxy-5-ureidoimidazoline decarboxylase [Solirubrobacteraceae bacterium]
MRAAGASTPMLSLVVVNSLDQEAFVRVLGRLFDHAPWVAGAAWRKRPFRSLGELNRALVASMREAPPERQLALIRAHPELGGGEVRSGELTADSSREQASAGLHRLAQAEVEALRRLNRSYRERFGFPLIVCVREHTEESILAGGAARLENSREREIEIALEEIAKIAGVRLRDVVEDAA